MSTTEWQNSISEWKEIDRRDMVYQGQIHLFVKTFYSIIYNYFVTSVHLLLIPMLLPWKTEWQNSISEWKEIDRRDMVYQGQIHLFVKTFYSIIYNYFVTSVHLLLIPMLFPWKNLTKHFLQFAHTLLSWKLFMKRKYSTISYTVIYKHYTVIFWSLKLLHTLG